MAPEAQSSGDGGKDRGEDEEMSLAMVAYLTIQLPLQQKEIMQDILKHCTRCYLENVFVPDSLSRIMRHRVLLEPVDCLLLLHPGRTKNDVVREYMRDNFHGLCMN